MISSINCPTSEVLEYIDYHLQPIVQEAPSYVSNTTYSLRNINQIDFAPENSYLLSLDVRLLYTDIQNLEEIKSVKTL